MEQIPFDLIRDEGVREAFTVVRDTFNAEPILAGQFKFVEIEFTAAGTFSVAHGLGFVPLDVIQTSLIGSTLTWNYNDFDATNLSVTVGGACTVRAFIGAYRSE